MVQGPDAGATSMTLPPEAAERLGPYYVYVLIDPRSEQIFYVGKGSGDRLLAHGREADLTSDESARSAKVQRIRDLRDAGCEPRIDIVRHGLSEDRAFEIEAALIDCLPGLDNRATGHGAERGREQLTEYVARYGATPVPDNAPAAVLIRLGKWKDLQEELEPGTYRGGNGYRADMTPQELVDATRAWWKISPQSVRRRGVEHAVAVHEGVTRGVLRIGDWTPRDDGRWAFSAELVNAGSVCEAWVGEVGRRVEFVNSTQNPIIYWPIEKSRRRSQSPRHPA